MLAHYNENAFIDHGSTVFIFKHNSAYFVVQDTSNAS
jgi:hypothetical protein